MQKKHKAIFLGFFEKANFPHFRHDNSADIQYLKFKLSGQVVTPLLLGTREGALQFGKDIAILDEQL